ncbi:hypothetical protein Pmani_006832 [Petrolisthes manimaculis]|uniref:Uncharacterized protein n=1 Tax=Petrolisthes manimaculis TaxID=1843537 RepID=A0AAE1Q9P7_9EUCA|nr:hypothetical protein Pmani_006832 [Petrolisthes manimaculis]
MKATVSFWIHLKGIASGTMNYGTCWSYQPMGHLEVLWFPGLLKKPCNSPYGIAGQTTDWCEDDGYRVSLATPNGYEEVCKSNLPGFKELIYLNVLSMKWDVEYISWLPASEYIVLCGRHYRIQTGVKMMVTESVWLHLMGIASGTMEYGTCWSYQLMSHLEVLWFPGLLKKPCNSPYGIAGQTTGAEFKVLQKPIQDLCIGQSEN